MSYESWRISYQSSEQAARAAFDEIATLRAQLAAAEARGRAEAEETRRLYNELIHQVGMKYPGESRHQTALRYLRLAETHVSGPAFTSLRGEVKPAESTNQQQGETK